MSNNAKTVIQIGLDSAKTIIHPRKHTQRVDAELEETKRPLAAAKASIDRTMVLLDDQADAQIASLAEALRFSDPKGTAETAEAEQRLAELCEEIEGAALSGSAPPDLIKQADRQLRIRNLICKDSK